MQKTCQQCGKSVAVQSKFCRYCGTAFAVTESSVASAAASPAAANSADGANAAPTQAFQQVPQPQANVQAQAAAQPQYAAQSRAAAQTQYAGAQAAAGTQAQPQVQGQAQAQGQYQYPQMQYQQPQQMPVQQASPGAQAAKDFFMWWWQSVLTPTQAKAQRDWWSFIPLAVTTLLMSLTVFDASSRGVQTTAKLWIGYIVLAYAMIGAMFLAEFIASGSGNFLKTQAAFVQGISVAPAVFLLADLLILLDAAQIGMGLFVIGLLFMFSVPVRYMAQLKSTRTLDPFWVWAGGVVILIALSWLAFFLISQLVGANIIGYYFFGTFGSGSFYRYW